MRVLAGDVGGTNARLALVDVEGSTARIAVERDYPSGDYATLATIVEKFLGDSGGAGAAGKAKPDRACLAVAGPVVDGRVHATNLPWTIDRAQLQSALGLQRLTVINDFFAVGIGLEFLAEGDVVTLQPGEPVAHGPVGYLGAGTGLGVGFRLWEGERYGVYSSEGGHIDFAPRNELQEGLLRYLRQKYGRASNERVLSGRGLADLYSYLAEAGVESQQPAVVAEMEKRDPAAVVTEHALAGDDALCARALELFVAVLGAVAGNLALIAVATGGIYIAGGIAPRIVSQLQTDGFLSAFHDQGRLSSLVARAPVHVVTNTKVGLLGAAGCAAR